MRHLFPRRRKNGGVMLRFLVQTDARRVAAAEIAATGEDSRLKEK
jgi:hypothetical protein